jgi:putative radical SAM enzyme (TIGR03279 family)
LGLEFASYLMDRQHHCKNKCIFCFVDQMPPGMRETLYFKDDDARLSFLFGNYITLTNLRQKDIDRMIKMHISPVNISVHTMDPALRQKLMGNPAAASSLDFLRQLAAAGIKINTQLVLCPGINDGEQLVRSLQELGNLYPSVESIAAVPVGLTKYREGLFPLRPYTQEEARAVIETIHRFSEDFLAREGVRLAYPADEFFLMAQMPIPDDEYYGEFNQLENGVGLLSLLRREIADELEDWEDEGLSRRVSLATGEAAAPFLREQIAQIKKRFPGLDCTVYEIRNDYFGEHITVAGLVTATDLIRQLKGKDLGEELLIPGVMLRHEQDRFLDDQTIEDVQRALGVSVRTVDNDGTQFLLALLGAYDEPEEK